MYIVQSCVCMTNKVNDDWRNYHKAVALQASRAKKLKLGQFVSLSSETLFPF